MLGNSKILLANGLYKNIEEIEVGYKVINLDGEPVSIIEIKKKITPNITKFKTLNWHNYTSIDNESNYWSINSSYFEWYFIPKIKQKINNISAI